MADRPDRNGNQGNFIFFSAIMERFMKYEEATTRHSKFCEEVCVHCARFYKAKKERKNDIDAIKKSRRLATIAYKKSARRVEGKKSSCKEIMEVFKAQVNLPLQIKNSSELNCVASMLKWCRHSAQWMYAGDLDAETRTYLQNVARTLNLPPLLNL